MSRIGDHLWRQAVQPAQRLMQFAKVAVRKIRSAIAMGKKRVARQYTLPIRQNAADAAKRRFL